MRRNVDVRRRCTIRILIHKMCYEGLVIRPEDTLYNKNVDSHAVDVDVYGGDDEEYDEGELWCHLEQHVPVDQ